MEIITLTPNELSNIIKDACEQTWEKATLEANERYVDVKEAAILLSETKRNIYRRIENKEFINVRKEDNKHFKILRSEVLSIQKS